DSSPVFTNCTFTDNEADVGGPVTHHEGTSPANLAFSDDTYISYGGAVAFEDGANPFFENCIFSDNLATIGGAMWSTWAEPNIADCNFVTNTAFEGGGVYFVGSSFRIAGSNLRGNRAVPAAGIFDPNDPNIPVDPNNFQETLGAGGGIFTFDANALIVDCSLTNNDANSSGGGIFITGSEKVDVRNCLITGNTANRDGGGISANWHSEPNLVNCTIVGNLVTGDGFATGYGGGFSCNYGTFATIVDSIIWGNVAVPGDTRDNGDQIFVGTGFALDPRPSTLNVSFSDIEGWQDPGIADWIDPNAVFVDVGSFLNWDFNSNIDEDPSFTAGFYLSQIASGQPVDSPAVDVGSADANDPTVGLGTYTTRTDGVGDANAVDMGFHHQRGLTQFRLTVIVIEDPNDPGIHGYVDPNIAIVYAAVGGNVVTLTAVPDAGYKVRAWTGTDDDTSTSRINTVTVTQDTIVTVQFEPAPLYNFFAYVVDRGDGPHGTIDPTSGQFFDGMIIPLTATPDPNYEVRMWYGTDDDLSRLPNNTATINGADLIVAVEFGLIGQNIINLFDSNDVLDDRSPFPTIQDAINAAEPNYTVVVSDGVYKGPGNYNLNLSIGLDPNDPNDIRPITVRSENGPDNCIIDADGLGRLFIFDANEPNDYIVDGFTLTGGYAEFGGAIMIDNSAPTITNCRITFSSASGDGGGIWMTNSSPIITNTEIRNCTSGGFGGGIYAEAGSTPQIINCLITSCASGDIGGAIYLFSSDATINLCTIAFNTGLDYGDDPLYPNPKGGVAARDSDPTIINCIIGRSGGVWPSFGVWGDQFSAGDDLYNCEATFSDIENGDDVGSNGNIDDDPLWVAGGLGNFYLSQFTGGQIQDSPALNAGEQYIISTLQAAYNLGNITTSIVNTNDVGFGDMGYHYPFFGGPPIEYSLQIYVVGNGTVDPNQAPEVHFFAPGTVVSLTAIVSVAILNSVTMSGNRVVFLEFESATPRVLNVSTDGQYTYLGIQDAIDDAREGDIVVLHSGTYAGTGFIVIGKNITITGTNPDDPNVVASTIIDATAEREGGIIIVGAPGGVCVLSGITIMNSRPVGLNAPGPQNPGDRGIDGEGYIPYIYMDTNLQGAYTGSGSVTSASAITVVGSHIIRNVIVRDCSLDAGNGSGGNAGGQQGDTGGEGGWGGSVTGAGLYITDVYDYYYTYTTDPNDPNYYLSYEQILVNWGGSPLIENCIFDNCAAIAGNGATGGNGANFGTGGRGGLAGRALGGGVFCGPGTTPTFINCTVTNCSVIAGNGGDGGDGGNPGLGGFGALTYADPCQPDPELYSAYGAGVYCGIASKPKFIGCTFSNNVTEGSLSGIGGINNPSGTRQQPLRNYNIPSYGAGVYCDSGSSATFENCTIQGNQTAYHVGGYTGYGGGVCFDGSKDANADYYLDYNLYLLYPTYLLGSTSMGTVSATFTDCQIVGNSASVGGGIYGYGTDFNITDSNFTGNLSFVGGGLCASDSLVIITASTIVGNVVSPEADPNTGFDPSDPSTFGEFKFGAGGGIYTATTDTVVRDCNIAHNIATGSGGGIYLFGDSNTPQIINNLITNNRADRDGGGISANWSASPLIANCTFVGNAAPGNLGEPNNAGLGGGFHCSYDSDCTIIDSIFWNNFAQKGDQIGIGTGFEHDPRPSTLTVSYSNVKGGQSFVWVDNNCTLNWVAGNIDQDPDFVTGSFYLSQTDAGQSRQSPSVDAGSNEVSRVGLIGYTTRTDGERDAGKVDMGYHYLAVEPCGLCDLVNDGFIDFLDFAVLADKWLDSCSEADGWCEGADVTLDTRVSIEDIAFLADCWLVRDTVAPIPDPSRWEIRPFMSGSSVSMTAEIAVDAWGWDVEYFFECVLGDCHDSGWQKSPTYTDTGLAPNAGYGYRVRTRDGVGEKWSLDDGTGEPGNKTEWSEIRSVGERDTTPPAPAPALAIDPAAVSWGSISMLATIAYDDSGVEYYFENTVDRNHDSGWQDEPNYTDVGLDPNTEYGYRVRARDKSPDRNRTDWSPTILVTTILPPELIPPNPDPMQWDLTVDPNGFDGTPREVGIDFDGDGTIGASEYGATMTAVVAVDAGGGPVEYFFECDESGFSSDWIPVPTYTVQLGFSGT
ncbi:MAG: right-handed parallel beta-helix repeat-containing protein, partial [Planctomycetota bacterium]